MGRYDRVIRNVGYLFLYVYNVSHAVLIGAKKDWGIRQRAVRAFLVMAIVGNACLPQLTAYFMHANEHIYYMAYCVPMICFVFCAYYGWKGYKVID